MPDRKIPPTIQPPDKIRFPQPEVIVLGNGIKAYMFDAGQQDVVSIELIFCAGSRYQEHDFSALAANMMLHEGTKNYTASLVAEKLDFYGAHFENTTERDNAFVALFSLNKHLPKTLPLLAEIVKYPVFPDHELKVLAGKQKQLLQVNRQKVNYLARTCFNPIIFGKDHPYGTNPEPEELDKLSSEMLAGFHQSHYHSGKCSIVVAGKIHPETKTLLEEYFGNSDWNGTLPQTKDFRFDGSGTKNHFIAKEGSIQSAIRMGRRMFDRKHPDFAGMKVLNTILGGYFGSRLMTNLREDKGFTYGIGSAIVPLRDSGYFVISGEVGAGVTDKSLGEIKNELYRLCDGLVPENELSLIRNYLAGEMLRAIDGPFARADLYRELIEDGLDYLYLKNLLQTVQQITAPELRNLATRYLDPDSLFTLVVGPERD